MSAASIARFKALTGADDATARRFLETADGDVDLAAALHASSGAPRGSATEPDVDEGGSAADRLVRAAERQARADAAASGTKADSEVEVVIFKNGFTVDGGEFRSFDEPQNKEFMDSVTAGRIPRELLSRGGEIELKIEDKRSTEFKEKPKPRVLETVAWGGGGGGATGGGGGGGGGAGLLGAGGRGRPPVGAAPAPAVAAAKPGETITVDQVADAAAPKATVMVVLKDGVRLKLTMNQSATVGELKGAVAVYTAAGSAAALRLQTHTGDVLDDDSATLEAKSLNRAKVTQV